jgi:phage/plasmid-associated DNA primase
MKSQFVANPRLPFQKPIDYELDQKMDMWPDAFLSVLLHYYQLNKIQRKQESPDMIADQNEIRKDVDFINQFIETRLISIGNEIDNEELEGGANVEYLHIDQIYAAYSLHCKEHDDAKPHSKINFRRALREKFRQSQNDLFACQFRSNNNEVHNN